MLKLLDMFGTSFQFTIFNQTKYKTKLGAITSIAAIILIIIFVYLFGKDFFLKLNPRINEEIIFTTNYPDSISITNNNLILPFRIEDETQSYTSFENILYPYFEYKEFKKNELDNNQLNVNNQIFYEKCDKLNLTDKFFIENYNLSQWFCLDFSKSTVKLGGYWDAGLIDYFFMKLNFIENNGNYDFVKLKEFLNKGRYISFLLPDYYFEFSDQTKPLKRIFKNYFYKLNLKLGKYDRIYLQNITSEDDRGWLVEEIYYDQSISTKEIKSDYFTVDEKDEQFNYLYKGVFYWEKDIVKITRNYMKIQELGARIGGFISFVMLFCGIVTRPYNMYKRNESLYNVLFDNNIIDCIKTNYNTMNNEKLKGLSDEITLIKNTKLSTSVKNDISYNKVNNSINFGFFQSIKYMFFPKCVSNTQIKNMKLYKFLLNYITERLDISFYIKLIENIKHFRILLLENKEQNLSFNYIKNPNLNDKNDLKCFEIDIDKDPVNEVIQLINYYRKIKDSKKIKDIDRELFHLLDSKITKYVGNLE